MDITGCMGRLISIASKPVIALRDLIECVQCDLTPALQHLPDVLDGFTLDDVRYMNEQLLRQIHGEYALAFDRLRAVCAVVLNARSPDAHVVLCRSALEPLGRTFWLLESEDSAVRHLKVLRGRIADFKHYRTRTDKSSHPRQFERTESEIRRDRALRDKLRKSMSDSDYASTKLPPMGNLLAALGTPNDPDNPALYHFLSNKAHSNPRFSSWGWQDEENLASLIENMERPKPTIAQVLMFPMLATGAIFEVSRRSADFLTIVRPDPNALDDLAATMQETIEKHGQEKAWTRS